jgi:hypothetical protein
VSRKPTGYLSVAGISLTFYIFFKNLYFGKLYQISDFEDTDIDQAIILKWVVNKLGLGI